MAWTTWIEIEPDDTANEVVQQLYHRTRDQTTGRPSDIVRLTSLTPQVAGLLHDLGPLRAAGSLWEALTPATPGRPAGREAGLGNTQYIGRAARN